MRDFEAISIVASGAITLVLARAFAGRLIPSPLALPNPRSLHRDPVPRTGGIAIWAGVSLIWFIAAAPLWWLAPVCAVLAISLWDDWHPLPATLRFVVHTGAAVACVMAYVPDDSLISWGLAALEILVLLWMTNLYNFMDGSDGLAASMGALGFGAYALAAWVAGAAPLAVWCGTVCAASTAFLVFNRPPARLFMGDVGSVGLGFFAALIGLHGFAQGIWPFWLPPLVFAPFVYDATATLLRRWRRGAPLAEAHREHVYQRKILLEGSHRGTLRSYALWMVVCAAAALAAARWLDTAGVFVLAAVYAGFGAWCRVIDRRWAAHERASHAA